MDKAKVRQIRSLIMESVAGALERDFGVKITSMNGTIYEDSVTFRLEVGEISAGGVVGSKEADALNHLYTEIGFAENPLGYTFDAEGLTFTVTGYNTRARKRPMVCEGSDGKTYGFTEYAVKQHLSRLVAKVTARRVAEGETVFQSEGSEGR